MSEIDIRDLKRESLNAGTFPVRNWEPFRVHFAADVHAGTHAHATADTSVEICGVLVGQWETDSNGPYALITNYIRCDNAAQKHAEVTFTQESWTQINHEMDTKYESLRIIGWYHSHPDFGIFLSDRDCFIQQHFFSGPGQVAFVIDPVRHLEGLFEWRDGKPTSMHHYWVGDKVHLGELRPAEKQAPKPGPELETAEQQAQASLAGGNEGGFMNWTIIALIGLCALLLGNYLTAAYYESKSRRHEIEVVANYEMFKVMRPGMEQRLAQVHSELGMISDAIATLENVQVEAADKKTLNTALDNLQQAMQLERKQVEEIIMIYGHTPDQIREFNRLFQEYHQPQPAAPAPVDAQQPQIPPGGQTGVVSPPKAGPLSPPAEKKSPPAAPVAPTTPAPSNVPTTPAATAPPAAPTPPAATAPAPMTPLTPPVSPEPASPAPVPPTETKPE